MPKISKIKVYWSALIALFSAFMPCFGSADGKRAWDFTLMTPDQRPFPLSQFKGSTLLLVNTASECGFTEQYKQLQDLWERYSPTGLVVLAVPSNNFGHQEPGSDGEIQKFCRARFQTTFPISAKTDVRGQSAHPLYLWAAKQSWARPQWNFHKYLIDRDGQVVDSFFSWTPANSPKIIRAIERQLSRSTQSAT